MASEEPYQLSPSLVFLPPGGMPQDLFRLADFQGVEEISSLFSYRLQLYSTDKNLAPDQLVGQPVAFGFTAFRNHRGVPTTNGCSTASSVSSKRLRNSTAAAFITPKSFPRCGC